MKRRGVVKRSRCGRGQLALVFGAGWGGRREGAGRKAASARRAVAHRARPVHVAAQPVHVTLRLCLRSLRSQFVYPTVRGAIADTNRRFVGKFSVVEYSVQTDHLHLIVEASGRAELHAGVRGLSVRLARRLNRLLFRSGRVLADRWHGRALATPRSVRHALVYVLANFRKHGETSAWSVDPYSSAPAFRHFAECRGHAPLAIGPPFAASKEVTQRSVTVSARSWLLRIGWLRHGSLSVFESPRVARAR